MNWTFCGIISKAGYGACFLINLRGEGMYRATITLVEYREKTPIVIRELIED